MKKKSEIAFDKYVSSYDKEVAGIRYKYTHSYRVEKLMKELATRLNLSKEEIKIAELIGLLHDIGRFEQIRKHGVSSDSKTHVDHADESCIYLFESGHIRDYIDDNKYDDIIRDAIKNHNKYIIDNKLSGKSLLFTKMIRDMDKVDIYKVVSDEYEIIYDKNEITSRVLRTFEEEKTINSFDKETETDTTLAHIAFLFDINFRESINILKETGNLDLYFDKTHVEKSSIEDFKKLKKHIYSYLDNFKEEG